jgi:hypothetical protein
MTSHNQTNELRIIQNVRAHRFTVGSCAANETIVEKSSSDNILEPQIKEESIQAKLVKVEHEKRWFVLDPSVCDLKLAEKAWDGKMELLSYFINPQSLSVPLVKRQEVIHELLTTELDYHRDIVIITELYMKQMRKYSIASEEEITIIFSNIASFLPVSKKFIDDLKARRRQDLGIVKSIGDILLLLANELKIYHIYCSNFYDATKFLNDQKENPDFVTFIQVNKFNVKIHSMTPTCAGLDLASFLLKPIQRICKYPLLLREIMKNTPETDPDHKSVSSAIAAVNGVVTYVNNKQGEVEQKNKMTTLLSQLEQNDVLLFNYRYWKPALKPEHLFITK